MVTHILTSAGSENWRSLVGHIIFVSTSEFVKFSLIVRKLLGESV